jgi:hypothetical protein
MENSPCCSACGGLRIALPRAIDAPGNLRRDWIAPDLVVPVVRTT